MSSNGTASVAIPIQVSWFASALDAVDPRGKAKVYTWPEFTADLALRLRTSHAAVKADLPMFVPAVWSGDRRNKASVACLTLGVLDVDGITQQQADDLWTKLQPYQAAVYPSPGDQDGTDYRKLRVIVTLDAAVLPAESKRLRQALAAELGIPFDRNTVDESRGFFAGSTDAVLRPLWVTAGANPANVKALLARVPADEADSPRAKLTASHAADPLVGDLSPETKAAIADYLADVMVPGQKNALVYALGGLLRQWGWSANDAADVIREALTQRDDVADIEAGVATLDRGYSVDTSHGYHRVKEILGDSTMQQIESVFPTRHNAAKRLLAGAQPGGLFGEAPPVIPPPAANPENDYCGFVFAESASAKPFDALIEGLEFAPGLGVAILGKYGRAKSPTAIEMGLCLANGAPWAGRQTQRCEVYYLAAEKSFDLREKRDRIARVLQLDPLSLRMIVLDEPLNSDPLRAKLTELVKRRTALERKVVLMIDTYAASVEGVDHNTSLYAQPLKQLLKSTTEAGACTIPLLHARKGTAADKAKPPTMDDAEGFGGIVGALSGCFGLYSSEDQKTKITYCCVRPVRRGFAPFAREWQDVAAPDGSDPEWGLRAVDIQMAQEQHEEHESLVDVSERVVKAASRFIHESNARHGVSLTDETPQARSLSALAEVLAADLDLKSRKVAEILRLHRVQSNVNNENAGCFPFWGHGDALNLRTVASTPLQVFDKKGSGIRAAVEAIKEKRNNR
jgi:hypothetical protein